MSDMELAKQLQDQLNNLVMRVAVNEISAAEAVQVVEQHAFASRISDPFAEAASEFAHKTAMQDASRWKMAATLHYLLNRAMDVRGYPTASMRTLAVLTHNWLEVVAAAVRQTPDPSLYKDAMSRSKAFVEDLRDMGKQNAVAALLHGMGTLNLDPYAAARSLHGYKDRLSAWFNRARQGDTWDGESYPNPIEEGYPTAADAFGIALNMYREAADLRTGLAKAASLKAVAQTYYAYALIDEEVDYDAARKAAQEGLDILKNCADADPMLLSDLSKFARGDEVGGSHSSLPSWIDHSIDELFARVGYDSAWQMVLSAVRQLQEVDPNRALRLALDARPLFPIQAADVDITSYHLLVLKSFSAAHGFSHDMFPDAESMDSLMGGLLQKAEKDRWDPAKTAAAMIALSSHAASQSEEVFALKCVSLAREIAPFTLDELELTLSFYETQLLLNEGVNAFNEMQWERAVEYYSRSLSCACDINLLVLIPTLVDRLCDVVHGGGAVFVSNAITDSLYNYVDRIEAIGGEDAPSRLQSLFRDLAFATADSSELSSSALWRLLQLAKGRRFAAMIAAGSAHRFQADEKLEWLRERLSEARRDLKADHKFESAAGKFSEMILLSPYASAGVKMTGDNAAERLSNLEHRFDNEVNERLASLAEGYSGLLPAEDEVRASLAEDCVLIQYYVPETDDGKSLVLAAVSTREETRWSIVRFDSQPGGRMIIDGIAVDVSTLGSLVYSLRKSIEDEPGAEVASSNALDSIATLSDLLIRPLLPTLAELRENGKKHLCLAAHGALQFAPLHLLGSKPGQLVEDWTITYLPSMQLLSTVRGEAALGRHRSRELTAFGLSFEDDKYYTAIPEASREAELVAKHFGGSAITNDEATEDSVLQAMHESRYIHIATHGEHCAHAPCFQKLRLTPTDKTDGDLYAHELLGVDLRGLELVTLSACETALGRYDVGDNPLGLPATLFLCGVKTVVGTLWSVESSCSEYFFTCLYRLLPTNSKLNAFREALDLTRKDFPQFRDWGAFYYSGEFR